MVDDSLGRRLVQSLILCRTTYESYDSPKVDKFAGAHHTAQYKKFSDELKGTFQSSGLQPFPFLVRPKGTHAVAIDVPLICHQFCHLL